MNLPKTKTTLLWKTAIRQLSENGAHPDPEDVVWLYTLADRVYHPTAFNRHLAFTRAPIILPALSAVSRLTSDASRLTLYPITFQAVTWLLAISEWWKGGDLIPAAYACAHSDGTHCATFLTTDRNAIETAISAWAQDLPCTPDDLRQAVRLQTNVPDLQVEVHPDPPDTAATEWGELLALLAGVYHLPPWEILMRPWKDIEEMLETLPRVAALHGSVAQDEKRSEALKEFQQAVIWLKKGGTNAYDRPDSLSKTEATDNIRKNAATQHASSTIRVSQKETTTSQVDGVCVVVDTDRQSPLHKTVLPPTSESMSTNPSCRHRPSSSNDCKG